MRRVYNGHSDIAEAGNWLLNEDTEAADVMASYRTPVIGCNNLLMQMRLQQS